MLDYFLLIIPVEAISIYSGLFVLSGLVLFILSYYLYYNKRTEYVGFERIVGCALDNAADIVFILDRESCICSCNYEFAEFVGFDKSLILGSELSALLPGDYVRHFTELDQHIRSSGDRLRFELLLKNFSGKMLHAEVIITFCPKFGTSLYIIRDTGEQERVFAALAKRNKMLYDLVLGTQRVLDDSQKMKIAFCELLKDIGTCAQVDVVFVARKLSPEECGYNVGHYAELYTINSLWSINDEIKFSDGANFEIVSRGREFTRIIEQEKIVFVSADELVFVEADLTISKDFSGFYAAPITCKGVNWGLLLLGSSELGEKWDTETEDAITVTAMQFGILLEQIRSDELMKTSVATLMRRQKRINRALRISGSSSFEYDLLLDRFDIDKTLAEKLGYGKEVNFNKLEDFKSLIYLADLQRWHNKISELLNGNVEIIQDVFRMRMSGGKYIWIAMAAVTVIENNAICGIAGVFQDIDDKIISLKRMLDVEKFAAVGELFSVFAADNISLNYELMTYITDFVASNGDNKLSNNMAVAEMLEKLKGITDVMKRMTAFVNTEFERPGLVDINRLLDDVIRMVSSSFLDSDINIYFYPDNELTEVLCSSNIITQVVLFILLRVKDELSDTGGDSVMLMTYNDNDNYIVIRIDEAMSGMAEIDSDGEYRDLLNIGDASRVHMLSLFAEKYGGKIEVDNSRQGEKKYMIRFPYKLSHEVIDGILPIGD